MTSKTILIPIPISDFDPTEVAVPWKILSENNVKVTFATPTGTKATCDELMLTGKKLNVLAPLLQADKNAQNAYAKLAASPEFNSPTNWESSKNDAYDGILLPGGHAQGMKPYLESEVLKKLVSSYFAANKPVGAICHGVVLAARSKRSDGKSNLYGRKTTCLLQSQEMAAWSLTCLWLKNYYRTYPQTVEEEVKSALQFSYDFEKGPTPIFRDSMDKLQRGFVVLDKNYLSARWPGDAHLFGIKFLELINSH